MQGEGLNKFGIGASVTVYGGGIKQTQQNFPTRGFQSSVESILTFGMDTVSTIDSLVIIWPDLSMQQHKNIPCNKEVLLKQSEANKKFVYSPKNQPTMFNEVTAKSISGNITHKENNFTDFDKERLMPHLLSTEGPKTVIADIDGDGLEDFIVGSAMNDTIKVFIQTEKGVFARLLPQPAFVNDTNYEDVGMGFLDADHDGDLDLIIASGGNLNKVGSSLLQPRLYVNNGKGIFELDSNKLPLISVNTSCVSICDFDKDGFPDIFIGGRSVPGQYGVTPKSYLLKNIKGVFEDVTPSLAPGLQYTGMVTGAIWQDIDNDQDPDLIVVGEWMPITIFTNEDGALKLSSLNEQFSFTNGWWNCIEAVDMDKDGDIDFVAGNLGLNSKIRADSIHPVQLYVEDFDNNGIGECIVTYYKKDDKSYPYFLKNDMVAQIPALKRRFSTHDAYASKTIDEIFMKDQLESALIKKAYQFRTCMFINDGNGHFEMKPLPEMAQMSPVYSILLDDLDGDNIIDIFLAGNLFGVKPELGRYDAGYGCFLRSTGNNYFQYLTPLKSGLFVRGAVRDIKSITTEEENDMLLIVINDAPLKMFKKNEN